MTPRTAIIGGGLMGGGIAAFLRSRGCEVRVFDSTPTPARTAETIREAVAGSDWVIESVTETLEAKLAVLPEIERNVRPETVISSNTSTFLPSGLSACLATPGRFLNTHFFRPAEAVPLVEVIPSRVTEPAVANKVVGWLSNLGKRPITLRREVPGFVANRLQAAVLREAIYLLDEGVASAEDIDAVMQSSIGPRWSVAGPFMIADLGGLDVFRAVCNNVFPSLSNAREEPATLAQLVDQGRLGAKSKGGFYHEPSQWAAASERIRQQFQPEQRGQPQETKDDPAPAAEVERAQAAAAHEAAGVERD